MPYKVLIRSEIEPYYTIIPMIEERAEIVRWNPLEPQPPAELLRTIEGVYNYGHYAFTAEYMDLMPDLRVISNYGVGVDHIDLQAAQERGIPVGNTPKILDGATADITFASSSWPRRATSSKATTSPAARILSPTDPSFMLGQEVHHQVIGIIGLGSIGYQVARRCAGLRHDRLVPQPQPQSQGRS